MTRLQRIEVVTETEVDGELFLVAPDSQEIFHLDAMASAIWRALEQPMSRTELDALFQAAFPDVPAARLKDDVDNALDRLQDGRLLSAQVC